MMNIGQERALQAQAAADIIAQAGIEFYATIEDANATRPSAIIGNTRAYGDIRGTEYRLTLRYQPIADNDPDRDTAMQYTTVVFIPQSSPAKPDALLVVSYGQYDAYNEYTPDDFAADTEDEDMDNVTFVKAYLAKKAEIDSFANLVERAQIDHSDVALVAFLEDEGNFSHAG